MPKDPNKLTGRDARYINAMREAALTIIVAETLRAQKEKPNPLEPLQRMRGK
jgi:hypothetical protein